MIREEAHMLVLSRKNRECAVIGRLDKNFAGVHLSPPSTNEYGPHGPVQLIARPGCRACRALTSVANSSIVARETR